MSEKKKKAQLKKLKPSMYKIYGIFDFQEKKLVFVHLELEKVELEYDFEDYNEERFDIVEFDVCLL